MGGFFKKVLSTRAGNKWPWHIQDIPKRKIEINGEWPLVSIVTPNLNQGKFLEETIRSVLLQDYPNLEYIIIDGESKDQSLEIIKKYEPWITYWISEPDHSQSDAINKGFRQTHGEVFGWMNSDDSFYSSRAITSLMELRAKCPEAVGWTGNTEKFSPDGTSLGIFKPRLGNKKNFGNFGLEACIYQPSTLMDAKLFKMVGGINEDLDIGLDYELWMRLAEHGGFAAIDDLISKIKLYPEAKHLQNPLATYTELIVVNYNHGFRDNAQQWLKFFADKYKNNKIKI